MFKPNLSAKQLIKMSRIQLIRRGLDMSRFQPSGNCYLVPWKELCQNLSIFVSRLRNRHITLAENSAAQAEVKIRRRERQCRPRRVIPTKSKKPSLHEGKENPDFEKFFEDNVSLLHQDHILSPPNQNNSYSYLGYQMEFLAASTGAKSFRAENIDVEMGEELDRVVKNMLDGTVEEDLPIDIDEMYNILEFDDLCGPDPGVQLGSDSSELGSEIGGHESIHLSSSEDEAEADVLIITVDEEDKLPMPKLI